MAAVMAAREDRLSDMRMAFSLHVFDWRFSVNDRFVSIRDNDRLTAVNAFFLLHGFA